MKRSLSLGVLFVLATAASAGPFDTMLSVVPATANTLVLIDVPAIYASPLAKSLKWSDAYAARFKAGMNTVPPDAQRIAIACATNMHTMRREWQLVLTQVRQVANAREIAARESGKLDEIAGRFAVLSPRDVYFTTISEQQSAAWYPANRQLLSHWLRNVPEWQKRPEPVLSAQLKSAVGAMDKTEPILIAFDLTDAFDMESIRAALDDSPVVAAANPNRAGLAKTLASLRGVSLAIAMTDALTGTIRVDFGLDPSLYKGVMKNLFLEALEDEGAAIGDLTDWTATFTNTSMMLKGKLDPAIMAHLLALFEFPSESEPAEAAPPMDIAKTNAELTKKYFRAVIDIIEEVRRSKTRKDYLKTATWHETYAHKIEHLSTRFVDPEATKFGLATAERLRAIAASQRGVPLDADRIAAGAFTYTYRNPYWRGWAGRGPTAVLSNAPAKRGEIAKVIADDEKNRQQIWSQIEKSIAEARVNLTAKYGNGFQ